jgi:hypothetical protein
MKERKEAMGLTWLKMDLGIEMVSDTPGTVTNPTDLNQWQANQLPHPLLGMEVTDKGIAMLEQYVAAVRDAVGMEIPLSMDHLGHLGVKSIIRLGKAYEKYNLSWMEDVIPWMYTDLLKQISDQSPTPILTGEDIYLKEPFRVLCEKHAIGKIQPDLATAGGVLETHKIGDMAEGFGVPMAMHFAGISDISEARTAASQLTTSDIAATQQKLAMLAGLQSDTSLRQLAARVSQILTEQKGRVQLLERLNTDISKSLSWREQLRTLEGKCEAAKKDLDATESALKTAADSRIAAGEVLRKAQSRTPYLGALAQLREHGLRINLQDGHCPLCGSSVSQPDFEAHLKHIQDQIDLQNTTLSDLTAQEASGRIEYEKRRNEFQTRSIEYSRALSDCETLDWTPRLRQSVKRHLAVRCKSIVQRD